MSRSVSSSSPPPWAWSSAREDREPLTDTTAVLDTAVQQLGGSSRSQQHTMLDVVTATVNGGQDSIVQAGTGTGKSLAYLCAAAASAGQVVVSTATKQLSDQLHDVDLPVVANTAAELGSPLSTAVLKGRSNYVCLAKIDEMDRLEAGEPPSEELELDFASTYTPQGRPSKKDRADAGKVRRWANRTRTGDRSEAPAVSNRVWAQVSTDSAGCPGARLCPFGNDCYAEKARSKAAAADIVVVNHALLAADLMGEQSMFSGAAGFIIDEVHEFESSLSSTWEVTINPERIGRSLAPVKRRFPDHADQLNKILDDIDRVADALDNMSEGRLVNVSEEFTAAIEALRASTDSASRALADTAAADKTDNKAVAVKSARIVGDIARAAGVAARGEDTEWVRQLVIRDDRKYLLLTPLQPGPRFHALRDERWLVATSATAAIGDDFSPTARALGLSNGEYHATDVGTVFNFAQQSLLYVPDKTFPEPVGADRAEHSAAFLDEVEHLVAAAGGRSLVLTTTVRGAEQAAQRLRDTLPDSITVLAHGDAAASALAEQFIADETSVLCATMGMWAGLNAPGPTCNLVIIDKIPFPPMNDPVVEARKQFADDRDGSGFREVFVANAALLLAQAAGRLIRSTSDKGVVAICDRRLITKGYGKTIRAALPPMKMFNNRNQVAGALSRLADASAQPSS